MRNRQQFIADPPRIDLFIDLKGRGLTLFMVTHDAVSAGRADRTLHIEDGVLQ